MRGNYNVVLNWLKGYQLASPMANSSRTDLKKKTSLQHIPSSAHKYCHQSLSKNRLTAIQNKKVQALISIIKLLKSGGETKRECDFSKSIDGKGSLHSEFLL